MKIFSYRTGRPPTSILHVLRGCKGLLSTRPPNTSPRVCLWPDGTYWLSVSSQLSSECHWGNCTLDPPLQIFIHGGKLFSPNITSVTSLGVTCSINIHYLKVYIASSWFEKWILGSILYLRILPITIFFT